MVAAMMVITYFAVVPRNIISAPGATDAPKDDTAHLAPPGGMPDVEETRLREIEPDRMASPTLAGNQVSHLVQNLIEQQTQLQKMASGLPKNPRIHADGLRRVLLTNSVRRIVRRHGSASLTESEIFALVTGELEKSR